MHGRAGQIEVGGIEVLSGGKPSLLVEFIIIGQIGFGHESEQGAALNDSSTVEQ